MSTALILTHMSSPVEKIIHRGYVMGFPHSPAADQAKKLVEHGCRGRDIYGEGHQTDFDDLVRASRSGQTIGTAGGLRVFGESRKAMMAALDALQEKGAEVLDVESGERSDKRGASMLSRALAKVQGNRTLPTSAEASAIGRLGAKATNRKIHTTRISIARARKLWFDMSISSVEAAERAGPGWSKGTMNRTFGESGRPKGPAKPRQK